MVRKDWTPRPASQSEASAGRPSQSPELDIPPHLQQSTIEERVDERADVAVETPNINESAADPMDELTNAFASTNIAMIPRAVRRANKDKSSLKDAAMPSCAFVDFVIPVANADSSSQDL